MKFRFYAFFFEVNWFKLFQVSGFLSKFVMPRNEESPQVTPQRNANLVDSTTEFSFFSEWHIIIFDFNPFKMQIMLIKR
ncbi:hypothetical protein DMB65_15965 [Flavobacterium cheongpyeongense]|uniref:Uncharacterized protein n=1 Tax=Flavobacterium cheongpyeongense TaxID=2212651 RepID=A0A2V4BLC2_9FLAO|nr:hypothetical protein DMB65_15965 [Flavobacterium cheongpyeongense]